MLDQYNASGTADIISASGGAASMVAQTISNIIDQKKRRDFEQSLSLLNSQQMAELNKKMLAAKTETDRLNILSSSLIQYATANKQASANAKVVMLGISGVLAVSLLIVAFFVLKTKKSNS